MGLISDLFGGSESKSESSSYRASQGKALDDLIALYSPQAGQGADIYSGTRVAPLSQGAQSALSGLDQFTGAFKAMPDQNTLQTMGGTLQGLLTGQSGADPYNPQALDNYYRNAIEAPAMQQWSRNIKPQIEEAYAGPGFYGSAKSKAVTEGSRDLNEWLGTQRSQLAWDAEQANKQIQEAKAGRALSALQPGFQYLTAPQDAASKSVQGLGQVASLAGITQQQAQAEINAAMQKFAEENRLTDPEDLQILMALVGQTMSKSRSSSESTAGIIPGISGALGALKPPGVPA